MLASSDLLEFVEEVCLLEETLAVDEVFSDLLGEDLEGVEHGILGSHSGRISFTVRGEQCVDCV